MNFSGVGLVGKQLLPFMYIKATHLQKGQGKNSLLAETISKNIYIIESIKAE